MSRTGIREAVLVLGALGLVAGCRTPPPAPSPVEQRELPPEVAQAVPPTRSIDHRPYELIWNPRREARDSLVDFEFVLGWTVDVGEGLTAGFLRTQEQQLWGQYVGKVTYQGGSRDGRIDLRPPEPLDMSGRFDSVNLWVYGFDPLPGEEAPRIGVQVQDVEGKVFHIPLGTITLRGWSLLHAQVPPATGGAMAHPCSFLGFRLEGCRAGREVACYLDSLSLYTQSMGALALPRRPRPNLPPVDSPSLGLREGEETLPFPVTGETVLPAGGEQPARVGIVRALREGIEWSSSRAGVELGYRCDPRTPARGVDVLWAGKAVGRVLAGGGVRGTSSEDRQITVLRDEGEEVYVEYSDGLQLTYRGTGCSLVIDVRRAASDVSGFELGGYEGPRKWRLLDVPGLGTAATVGWLAPEQETDVPLFTSAVIDWYRSNASELYGATGEDGGVASWGGMRYRPRTDDQRLDLHERVVVSVSPLLDDVLPAVANPAGEHREALSRRVWVDSSGPQSYATELARAEQMGSLGMTNVVQCHLQACWQDGSESRTLRTNAAPRRGGDEALQSFLAGQQALGWWAGLYVDPLHVHPLNAHWSENLVLRDAAGEWTPGLPGHYRVKAPLAIALHTNLCPVLREKFRPDVFYVGDMTAEAPWARVDYDARVPGAGSFGQTFYGVGEVLACEPGPVVGNGGMESLYAGLLDGFLVGDEARAFRPYLPLFCLQRLAPLASAFGAGVQTRQDDWEQTVDRAIAAQLAYGAMGRLAPEGAGRVRQLRSYYAMVPVQQRYAGRVPDRIAYWTGEHYLNTSEAIASGVLERSQLYLLYEDVLEVWVNGCETREWTVRVGRDTWVLPPFGWVASGPDLLAVSGLRGGRRVDYVQDGEVVYFDGRGGQEPFRDLASPTPVRVSRDAEGLTIHDLAGGGLLALGPSFGIDLTATPELTLLAGKGAEPREHPYHREEGMLWIRGLRGEPARYRLDLHGHGKEGGLSNSTVTPQGNTGISGDR